MSGPDQIGLPGLVHPVDPFDHQPCHAQCRSRCYAGRALTLSGWRESLFILRI